MIQALLLIAIVAPFLWFSAIGCLRVVAALEWLDRIDRE